mmetsp:Transcript_9706/g.24937  ORF Transcript_9706/g.24937 Transcript_9706/m.24937 type:complete len:291 (+) Transcript_9706:52-924(+)
MDMGGGKHSAMPKNVRAVTGFALIAMMVTMASIRVVPPAHIGVVVTFGSVAPNALESGLHLVNPFADTHNFATKTLLLEQANHVPTSEGLTVDLDVAVLFHIDPSKALDIFLNMGRDYVGVVMKPELASTVRGLTAEVEAKALYTTGRATIQSKLKGELLKALSSRGIIVEDVLLKAVTLPQELARSIELKAQAEQESARMQYVLSKERQEAERKEIEARGIAAFQRIVSEGISPALLQWKAVEATERLITSQNSKIIMVGNTHNDLPIMLSGDNDLLHRNATANSGRAK